MAKLSRSLQEIAEKQLHDVLLDETLDRKVSEVIQTRIDQILCETIGLRKRSSWDNTYDLDESSELSKQLTKKVQASCKLIVDKLLTKLPENPLTAEQMAKIEETAFRECNRAYRDYLVHAVWDQLRTRVVERAGEVAKQMADKVLDDVTTEVK